MVSVKSVLLFALCVSPLMAAADKKDTTKKVETAAQYGSAPVGGNGYAPPNYGPQPPPYYPPQQSFISPNFPVILDDHVCDLEAPILIANFQKTLANNAPSTGYGGASQGGYGGSTGFPQYPSFENPMGLHANSKRFSCADVAATDADSCNVCCRLATRRDRSIKASDIFGVIVDTLQLNQVTETPTGSGSYRVKRHYGGEATEPEVAPPAAPSPPDFQPSVPAANTKCMCCMPRRRSVVSPFPHNGPQPPFFGGYVPPFGGGYGQGPAQGYGQAPPTNTGYGAPQPNGY
uniref:Uncharacterized protein n=1 Tax=Rhabditophanes sp. KR3021 TaxID=114890 RepID=A0AC35U616_9BILA